jgi:hypothetical protein
MEDDRIFVGFCVEAKISGTETSFQIKHLKGGTQELELKTFHLMVRRGSAMDKSDIRERKYKAYA